MVVDSIWTLRLLVVLPWLLFALALAAFIIALTKWLKARAHHKVWEAAGPPPVIDADASQVLSVLRSSTIVLDPDGEIISASPRAYASGLVKGDDVAPAAVRDLVANVRQTGETQDMELEIPRSMPGAPPAFARVRVAPMGKGRILVLASDRTEMHRIDMIRRDFVLNVTQELSAPVAELAELADTLEQSADDPELVRGTATQLSADARRLSALVEELIELSRIQSAGALSDNETVHLRDVIQEAVEREQKDANAKNIRITTAGAEDVLVYGDHELLVTALRNLLDNAVTYSPNNTRVGIGVSERDGMVEVAVVDQGLGVHPDEQQRIFERFYRTNRARDHIADSTGLGLSLVKHIASGHGGEVTVWSAPNRGSTFTLRIPAADVTGIGQGAPDVIGVREAPVEASKRQQRAFNRKANKAATE